MLLQKVFECDCGYWVGATNDGELVARAREHAKEAHGLALAADLILVMARPKEPNRQQSHG